LKIAETLIRKLIIESIQEKYLLTEARFALKNLLIFKETIIDSNGGNLFDAVNENFIANGGSQNDLNNPKSAGRFFIDVLFECMEELDGTLADNPNSVDIPDWIMTVTNYILFLFSQKEVTSRSVLSGETFKDYVLNFMLNYDKLSFPGAVTIYEKLKYVYQRLNEKSIVNNVDAILRNKDTIKRVETSYPFDEKIVSGYLIVAPKTVQSSIFWARTNWLGEDIVLPGQDDISWCTARFKGGNMFTSYYNGGGTTLFYFLPEGDTRGNKKFCIGIMKKKKVSPAFQKELKKAYQNETGRNFALQSKEDREIYEYEYLKKNPENHGVSYDLLVGGHTTVGFSNQPIFKDSDTQNQDLNDVRVRQKINSALNIKDENVLLRIIKEMKNRDFIDLEKYIALIDVEVFAAATNLDTLAPIDPATGQREREGLSSVSTQIQNVLSTYNSKLYKYKGYVPDEKILNYIDKNYSYWMNEGITLPFYIPKKFQVNENEIFKFIKSTINRVMQKKENNKIIYRFFGNSSVDDIFRIVENALQKLGLNLTDFPEVVEDLTLLTFLLNVSEIPSFIKNYFDFSTVQGLLNFIKTLESIFLKYGITKDSELYEPFAYSMRFGKISDTILKYEKELKRMDNSDLLDLFFKTKIPALVKYLNKENIINNRQEIISDLNLKDNGVLLKTFDEIAKDDKDFMYLANFVALVDVELFAAATNIDNANGHMGILGNASRIIKIISEIYFSNFYKDKGYIPDKNILKYIETNYLYWRKEGVDLPFYIPKKFRVNENEISKFIKLTIKEEKDRKVRYESESANDIYEEVEKVFRKLGLNLTDFPDVIEDLMLLTLLLDATNSFPSFVLNYFDFSTVQGFSNYVNTLESLFLKYGITKDAAIYKSFVDSKRFGTINSMFSELKEELSMMDNSSLVNLFFETKIPAICQYIDREYLINNKQLVLKIVEFAQNNVYCFARESIAFFLFCKKDERGNIIKETFPIELLKDKEFLSKLMEIDKNSYQLLETYNIVTDEKEILKMKIGNSGELETNDLVGKMIEKEKKNKKTIEIEFLKNLLEVNPLSFFSICKDISYGTETYTQNFKNMLTVVTEFLSDDQNILKLVTSSKEKKEINSEGIKLVCIPFGSIFSSIMTACMYPVKFIQRLEEAGKYNELFKRYIEIEDRLRSNFPLAKYILELIENQYIENKESDDVAFNKELEKFYKQEQRRLILSMKKEVVIQLLELIDDKSIITDFDWRRMRESKNIKLNYFSKGKLILTENQLRSLIAKNLRS
jgi:hypothetical protein